MKLFICEKPSQALDISKHVGARQRSTGCNTGAGVTVTWCVGHLLEQAAPEHYNPALKIWTMEHLPVVPQQWKMNVKSATKSQFTIIARLLKSAVEVVIATDADREGEVIARIKKLAASTPNLAVMPAPQQTPPATAKTKQGSKSTGTTKSRPQNAQNACPACSKPLRMRHLVRFGDALAILSAKPPSPDDKGKPGQRVKR